MKPAAGHEEAAMRLQAILQRRHTIRVPDDVLRAGIPPAIDPRKRRVGMDAQTGPDRVARPRSARRRQIHRAWIVGAADERRAEGPCPQVRARPISMIPRCTR